MRDYYFIHNTDGTPRWMWPTNSKSPLFLKLYTADSKKQKLFKFATQIIFRLSLQKVFFKKGLFEEDFSLPEHQNWALFYGTPGPNNKRVLFYKNDLKQSGFLKIANGINSHVKISEEAHTLASFSLVKENFSFEVPDLNSKSQGVLDMTGIPIFKSESTWSQKHTQFLKDMSAIKAEEKTVGNWSTWYKIGKRISTLSADESNRIPQNLIDKVILLKSQINRNTKYNFQFTHGDFTPWNSFYTQKDKLGIIDWEMAQEDGVFGADFFHFHLQNGILVRKDSAEVIYKTIFEKAKEQNIFRNETEFTHQLRLYVLDHVSYYAQLYQDQKDWHVQINWQMDVWVELLSQIISLQNDRKLFMGDFFQFMKDKNYAGLKLRFGRPEDLNEYSDLDLVISKKELPKTINWIKKRGNVEKVNVLSQSYMKSLTILFKDGTRLQLDLILRLKRKSTVYLNTKTLLENAKMNSFGVKECSPYDTSLFISLFYGLNKSLIPAHYKKNSKFLLPLKEKLEKITFGHYHDDFDTIPEMHKYVENLKSNKGIRGAANKLIYFYDSIKKFVGRKGMIVSFSGVDGAGKTTIINEIKREFDKKYRKPVVVLRHRPSLIPILSAYKYGKDEAEKRSVASLPRQGENSSTLNSLLRFAYYYTDYFFGQFYVYVKYVMRGYVVIYDRYYFDMINDGKRSNIQIPRFITRLGYVFLLKPKHNFFLYASPDTILKRKEELDVKTIQSLNLRYKKLFSKLQKGSIQSKRYVSINNEVLKDTKQQIFQTIGQIQ